MIILSESYIVEGLRPYGFSPSPRQCEQVRAYISLLLRWNQEISLTRITEIREIIRLHFGESLFAVPTVPILEGRLADVGSGNGFPGLALRMAVSGLQVTLIEPNMKKVAFLREAARELGLDAVEVIRCRMNDVPSDHAPFDFVAARALGQHADLLDWASRHLQPAGRVLLWVGEEDSQVISKAGGWIWESPVRIPGSKQRFLLIGHMRR